MRNTKLDNLVKQYINENNKTLYNTIMKEVLHYDILESLEKSKLFDILVFQGGTALRLLYDNLRYSEDLDFVLKQDVNFDNNLMSKFEKIFISDIAKKYDLEAKIKLPKNNNSLIVQKWSAKIIMPSHIRRQVINIEIANIKSYDNSKKFLKNYYNKAFNILLNVESKEEILADKIIALARRKYLRYRDIWDIKFLKDENIKINSTLIKQKIIDYNILSFESKLKEKILNFKNAHIKDFYLEMSRFLESDLLDKVKIANYYDDIIKCLEEVYREVKLPSK